MKSLGSIGSFLQALLLVLLAFICTGNSFKQELWLYDAQDNALQFHFHVADTSDYSLLLPKVTRACARGHSSIVCTNFTTAASVKSLRHWGANDTDTDALSLYEGNDWSGKEILVTARARTEITNKITSITGTGTSDWMLFEGQDLDGKSTCYQVPVAAGYLFSWDFVSSLNLTTIGSVFKGCDAQEIKNYKRLHSSSFVNSS